MSGGDRLPGPPADPITRAAERVGGAAQHLAVAPLPEHGDARRERRPLDDVGDVHVETGVGRERVAAGVTAASAGEPLDLAGGWSVSAEPYGFAIFEITPE